MILWKEAQKQDGNFLAIISFVATAFVLFFALFSYVAQSYLTGQEDSKIAMQAEYAAESILGRLPFEYNQNMLRAPAKTILHETESFCKNYSVDDFGENMEQVIFDFGASCKESSIYIGDGRSSFKKYTSRMVKEENGYIDRYQLFEYRLMRSEYLELLNEKAFAKPAKLKIHWWNDKKPATKNPKIEFILVSWEQENNNAINSNISVHRIIPRDDQIVFNEENGINSFELSDISKEGNPALFCNEDCEGIKEKEYIIFIKSFSQPLHFSIRGYPSLESTDESLADDIQKKQKAFQEAISEEKENIQQFEESYFRSLFPIPSRYLGLEVSTNIENEQNPLDSFIKTLKAQKELYRDFDSNFPYVKYEIR